MKTSLQISPLKFRLLLVLLTLHAALLPANAELTARVYAGYIYASGERPTTATLNLLGTPTIVITGTLGGTNVALGAGTVSGTMLMDSVAGSNLTWDANSPRGLVIANDGVGLLQLDASAFGLGLSGGSGSIVRVTYDTNSITLDTNGNLSISSSYLTSAAFTNAVRNEAGVTNVFVSDEYSITSAGAIATNHSFGVTPRFVRWVLVCKTNELNYSVGDEVDVSTFQVDSDNPAFLYGASATNVFLIRRGTANLRALDKVTGGVDTLSNGGLRWRAKCYASP